MGEKSGDNVKHSIAASKITPEKNNVLPASRSSESISVNSGNKSITTSTNSQNNTFKVRRDTSYYTGSAPITTDIPIFREEFLEHNKAREAELKQLRKQANEFEEQNAILQKHVENMRSAIGKLEQETTQQQENNIALTKHLDAMRRLVVQHFQGMSLPLTDDSEISNKSSNGSAKEDSKLTMENVD